MLDTHRHTSDLIWNIANLLRGPYRPPQYRRVMIPLTVLRHLDCVLEGKLDAVMKLHGKLQAEGKYDAEVLQNVVNQRLQMNFHNTSGFTLQKLLGDLDKLAAVDLHPGTLQTIEADIEALERGIVALPREVTA